MENNIGGCISLFICIIYGLILQHLTGRRTDTNILLKSFIAIFTAGWIFHIILFINMTASGIRSVLDWVMILYFSAQCSIEMFVGKTLIFKGAVNPAISGDAIMFASYMTIFYMAIITSALVIFHFISRIAYGRRWLYKKENIRAAENGSNHIFLGICDASRILAANIRAEGTDGKIIFIDIPNEKDQPKGLSVWDIISKFLFRDNRHDDLQADVILRADGKMKGLLPWLQNSRNNVYILSEDQNENLRLMERIWQTDNTDSNSRFRCHIYCHAVNEGLVSRYDAITDVHNRVTFVDSAYLAVQSLKIQDNQEMLPVRYVTTGKDPETGRKAGWVESGFNSAIIGFGETGQEALKFLYEFGAFVGKDKQKVPFRCHIFDKDPSNAYGEFRRKVTLQNDNEICFESCAVETGKFWDKIDDIIDNVNYVIVCLGDDMLSLKTGIDIAEYALQKGRRLDEGFVIAIRQMEYSALDHETLKKTNKALGNCIRPFGMTQDIWRLKVMDNRRINDMARRFYTSYMGIESEEEAIKAWQKRDELLRHDDYRVRSKARRQIAQDYSNCLHSLTKKALCDSQTALAAAHILPECIGDIHTDRSRCSKKDEEILEYLAIGEHLRWNASHIMMGYRLADETCDLKKTHSSLVPYSELDETTKHYDWLVVKNSLI